MSKFKSFKPAYASAVTLSTAEVDFLKEFIRESISNETDTIRIITLHPECWSKREFIKVKTTIAKLSQIQKKLKKNRQIKGEYPAFGVKI